MIAGQDEETSNALAVEPVHSHPTIREGVNKKKYWREGGGSVTPVGNEICYFFH